jgi:hypothetical protein
MKVFQSTRFIPIVLSGTPKKDFYAKEMSHAS